MSSRFTGVTWHKQDERWQAAIKIDGRSIHLGHFEDETEAARKYDELARVYGRSTNFQLSSRHGHSADIFRTTSQIFKEQTEMLLSERYATKKDGDALLLQELHIEEMSFPSVGGIAQKMKRRPRKRLKRSTSSRNAYPSFNSRGKGKNIFGIDSLRSPVKVTRSDSDSIDVAVAALPSVSMELPVTDEPPHLQIELAALKLDSQLKRKRQTGVRHSNASPKSNVVISTVKSKTILTIGLRREILRLVYQLIRHDNSYYFRKPVDEFDDLDEKIREHYGHVVTMPMDLRSIFTRLIENIMPDESTIHDAIYPCSSFLNKIPPWVQSRDVGGKTSILKNRTVNHTCTNSIEDNKGFARCIRNRRVLDRSQLAYSCPKEFTLSTQSYSLENLLHSRYNNSQYNYFEEVVDDLNLIWRNAEQFNAEDSDPVRSARILKNQSGKAINSIISNGTFSDLEGFTDWRLDHELIGQKFVDNDGDSFVITGWLPANLMDNQEELWHACYEHHQQSEFDMDKYDLQKIRYGKANIRCSRGLLQYSEEGGPKSIFFPLNLKLSSSAFAMEAQAKHSHSDRNCNVASLRAPRSLFVGVHCVTANHSINWESGVKLGTTLNI